MNRTEKKLVILVFLVSIAIATMGLFNGCSSEKQAKEISDANTPNKPENKVYEEYGIIKVPKLQEERVAFEKIMLPNTIDRHTSLAIGPDGKLYASTIDGRIKRFNIKEDGTFDDPEIIYSLQDASGERTPRLTIGLEFDPEATPENLIAYVTHHTFLFKDAPDWDGKLTRLSGRDLQEVQDLLVSLPRSAKDHLTNSISFGPDGALYFTQGSNTAMGAPDKTWQFRDEHLLSASVLRLDLSKLDLMRLPLDVKTHDGGGDYNPLTSDAPLTIYATGLRNAYDLLWHSNNSLYVPSNGSAAGGNTPASIKRARKIDGSTYKGPDIKGIQNVKQVQKDFLFKVEQGGYYGHPNPVRAEFVMNGGNPTEMEDPGEVVSYPVGTMPDSNWRGYSFDFYYNLSPNGIIEYKGEAFNGALKGKILVATFANNKGIIVLEPGGDKNDIIAATEGFFIPGFSDFIAALDLVEDLKTGNLYVSEFGGDGKITLLKPKVLEAIVIAENRN